MKINDFIPGIHFHMEAISPEAAAAQRQAELQNLARYRAQKLQRYIDWSDPVKRAALQAIAAVELEESKKIAAKMLADNPLCFHQLADKISTFKLTPIYKPALKTPWYRRIWNWILIKLLRKTN